MSLKLLMMVKLLCWSCKINIYQIVLSLDRARAKYRQDTKTSDVFIKVGWIATAQKGGGSRTAQPQRKMIGLSLWSFFAIHFTSHRKYSTIYKGLEACKTYGADSSHQQRNVSIYADNTTVLPPLIHHIISDQRKSLASVLILRETGLPMGLAKELLEFGAIYYSNQVTLPADPSLLPMVKNTKRLCEDILVKKGEYLRVHVNPRRYPAAQGVNWSSSIMHTPSYLIVNKPPAMPVQSTVDNDIENLHRQLETHTNKKLFVTTRLDVCTGGLICLANSSQSAAQYHTLIKSNAISKCYKVLTAKPVQIGLMRHYMRKTEEDDGGHRNAKPSLLTHYPLDMTKYNAEDWNLVELDVLSCNVINLSQCREDVLCTLDFISSNLDNNQVLYESSVELLTGKTHQIRLQYSTSGHAILGDTRYKLAESKVYDDVLEVNREGRYEKMKEWLGPEPLVIGLQSDCLTLPSSLLGVSSTEDLNKLKERSDCDEIDLEVMGEEKVKVSMRRPFWRS